MNVVGSHTVYKVKTDEEGNRKLKARLRSYENENEKREHIGKDSPNAKKALKRLLQSIVTFLGFLIETANIKGAYLQIEPVKRQIHLRLPKQWHSDPNYSTEVLWKLTKLPYGIVEDGRQWMPAIEERMLTHCRLKRVLGVNQLVLRRSDLGCMVVLVAKLSDEFLVGSKLDEIDTFLRELHAENILTKITDWSAHNLDCCEIIADRIGNTTMSMQQYWQRIKSISMTRTRRKICDG